MFKNKRDDKYKIMIGTGILKYWLLDPNNLVVATFKTKQQAEESKIAMNSKDNLWQNPEILWKNKLN